MFVNFKYLLNVSDARTDGAYLTGGCAMAKMTVATAPMKRTAPRLFHPVPARPKRSLVKPSTTAFPRHGSATERATVRTAATKRTARASSARFVPRQILAELFLDQFYWLDY